MTYHNGRGVEWDTTEAIRWNLMAAEQGVTVSQISIGTAYSTDDGAEGEDDEAAVGVQDSRPDPNGCRASPSAATIIRSILDLKAQKEMRCTNSSAVEPHTRAAITDMVVPSPAAKGGKWDTGILEHNREFFIFANIGTPGRTGHDYSNRWEGLRLRWYHKNGSHLGWPSVQRLVQPGRRVHVFWRETNRTPFEYAGRATPWTIENTTPVEILVVVRCP